jgi:hypothetical protein
MGEILQGARKGEGGMMLNIISRLLGHWIGNFIIGGWISKLLWNAILVDAIGVNRLTYWEAVGLVVLIHTMWPTANLPAQQSAKKEKTKGE